jgi:uncharacterized membrane protein
VKNKTYITLLVGSTLWCLSIIAAPLFHARWLYQLFSSICHQDPTRSWHLSGEPFAACIRCTSIYLAVTASLWLGLKTNVRWLRFSVLLMIAEFVFARLVFDNVLLRSASGVFVGLSAGPFIKAAVEEIRESM